MKVIDLLNKMANKELEDEFKFKYRGDTYRYNKNSGELENFENDCTNFGDTWRVEEILNDEVEVIEEKEEIKEIEITERDRRIIMDFVIKTAEKTNELVRVVNRLTKEREKK